MVKENDSAHKLTPKAIEYVLQALAERKRGAEIRVGLKEGFGVESYSDAAISGHRKRHKSAIAHRHRKWAEDVEGDIDLASKKVRIREYTKRYWGFYDNCLNGKPEHQFSEKENRVLNNLLEHIRVEMEGKGFAGVGKGSKDDPIVIEVLSHIPGL